MNRQNVEMIKKLYPIGCKVMVDHMSDPYNPVPSGTIGTVKHIDSIGQLHGTWGGLALIYGVDKFHKI